MRIDKKGPIEQNGRDQLFGAKNPAWDTDDEAKEMNVSFESELKSSSAFVFKIRSFGLLSSGASATFKSRNFAFL